MKSIKGNDDRLISTMHPINIARVTKCRYEYESLTTEEQDLAANFIEIGVYENHETGYVLEVWRNLRGGWLPCTFKSQIL